MSTNEPMTQEQLDAIRERLDCGTPTTSDVDDLLAEVKRLRALTTVDDAMVERAARMFYEYPAPNLDVRTYWDRINAVRPEAADLYRLNMASALNAALGTGEEA